jgi:hypothetical protein
MGSSVLWHLKPEVTLDCMYILETRSLVREGASKEEEKKQLSDREEKEKIR